MKSQRYAIIVLLTILMAVTLVAACSSLRPANAPATLDPAMGTRLALDATAFVPTPTFSDPVMREADMNYAVYCAHCHGYNLEGQTGPSADTTRALGMLTVPPHDSTGHTWWHPDDLLVEVIQNGIQNPLDLYPMAGFGDVLTEQQIRDIIDYLRLWWTEDQVLYQRAINDAWEANQAQMESGD